MTAWATPGHELAGWTSTLHGLGSKVADAQLATATAIALHLGRPARGVSMLITMRAEIEHPRSHDDADLLAWSHGWMNYRFAVALVESALVEAYRRQDEDTRARWWEACS